MPGVLPTPADCCSSPCGESQCIPTPLDTIIDARLLATFAVLNVRNPPFNAACDGVHDDTAAVSSAYNSLPAEGGILYIPGQCRFNLTVLKNNVHIIGGGNVKNYDSPVRTAQFMPADLTKPVIQVGNNTAYVRGFQLTNATINGAYGGNYGDMGIYFAGGAFEAHLSGVTVWNCKTCFKFQAGTSYASSKIHVVNFTFQPAEVAGARGIHAIMLTNQTSFTTAIYFCNGDVNGPSAAGSYAVEVDGTFISLSQVYMDLTDGHGILYSATNPGVLNPYITCTDLILDGANSTDILLEANANIRQVCSWLRGIVSLDGHLHLPNGANVPPPAGHCIPYQSQANYLEVVGELALTDSVSVGTYNNTRRVYSDGTNVWLQNDSGLVKLQGSLGVKIDPVGGGIELVGGTAGAVAITAGNLAIDNGKSVDFKDSTNTLRTVLTAPAGTDNIALQSQGTLSLTSVGNCNITAQGIIATIGGSNSITLVTADVYLDNGRAILFKNSSAAYKYGLLSSGDDILSQPTRHFSIDTTTGALRAPRMTKAQRNALAGLVGGEIIYQTDGTVGLHEYRSGAWGVLGWTADP